MNKKLCIALIIMMFSFITLSRAEDKILITVNQFVSHIALDAAYEGLNNALSDQEIVPKKAELILSNAQGNITNSVQISKHQASLRPRFMVAIATPSAQTGLKAKGNGTTLAFVAVTDPAAANLTGHDAVIGVSDNPPIKELVDIARKIFPKVKSVGIISNSGEINSVKTADSLEKILKNYSIELKRVSITSSNDIKSAMNKLIGNVDIIYLPQDNSVVSALDNIAKISRQKKVPLIANDPTLVDKGVLLALGANYFKGGEQLGNMIADLIKGKILDQNIQNTNVKELKINYKIAEELGITIPKDLKVGAK